MYENNNNTNKNNGFDTANEDLTPIDLDSIVLDDLYRPTTTTNDANSSVDSPVQPNNSTGRQIETFNILKFLKYPYFGSWYNPEIEVCNRFACILYEMIEMEYISSEILI